MSARWLFSHWSFRCVSWISWITCIRSDIVRMRSTICTLKHVVPTPPLPSTCFVHTGFSTWVSEAAAQTCKSRQIKHADKRQFWIVLDATRPAVPTSQDRNTYTHTHTPIVSDSFQISIAKTMLSGLFSISISFGRLLDKGVIQSIKASVKQQSRSLTAQNLFQIEPISQGSLQSNVERLTRMADGFFYVPLWENIFCLNC